MPKLRISETIPLLPNARLHSVERDSFNFTLFVQRRSMFTSIQCVKQYDDHSIVNRCGLISGTIPGIFPEGFRKITKNYQDRRFTCLNKGNSACNGRLSNTERVVWMGHGKHDSERSCSMQAGNSLDQRHDHQRHKRFCYIQARQCVLDLSG